MSPVLQCNGLIMKKSYSILLCNFLCFSGPCPYRSISSIFYICSAILSWLLYTSDQSSTEALFTCFQQSLVPDLSVLSSDCEMKTLVTAAGTKALLTCIETHNEDRCLDLSSVDGACHAGTETSAWKGQSHQSVEGITWYMQVRY